MTKSAILRRLQDHLNYVIEVHKIPSDRILGIFLFGSQNYELADTNSDVDSIILYVPSFDDICFQTKAPLSTIYNYLDGEHIVIHDIRLYRNSLEKQSFNSIEILYTNYHIINEKYRNVFETFFINHREQLSKIDIDKLMLACVGQMRNRVNKLEPTSKELANALRLKYFIKHFHNGTASFDDCMRLQGWDEEFNEVWNVKMIDTQDRTEEINKYIKELHNKLKIETEEEFKIYSQGNGFRINKEAINILNDGVKEIMKYAFEKNDKPDFLIKDFYDQLTSAEKRAYDSIVKVIGVEGSVSISQLVESNKISRPVYNNLINKMKNNKIANIVNQGVNGTYIKIINKHLIADILNN